MRKSVRYSQNFLRNPKLIEKLVAGSTLATEDTVLDIGAGSGSITRELAKICKHVIAYEADARLANNLRAEFAARTNVKIVVGDFLAAELSNKPYKVFANPPFSHTSDIVRKLLNASRQPEDTYLIMQREAAQKFMGLPGNQSLFATLHQPWFDMQIIHTFHHEDFTPQPDVATALLRITRRSEPLIARQDSSTFRDLVSYVYNHANPNILPAMQKLFPGSAFQQVESVLGPNVTAKPSYPAIDDWLKLLEVFKTCAENQIHIIAGSSAKLRNEASQIEKHHRTRSAKNWRTS